MAVALCKPRPSPGSSRVKKALVSAVAACAGLFVAAPCFVPLAGVAPSVVPFAGESLQSLSVAQPRECARGDVAMRAEEAGAPTGRVTKYPLRKWKGSARYKRYTGYVYHMKRIPFVRIRLARWGVAHNPFYRIRASFQKSRAHRSGRFLEHLGWYDPMRQTDDPKFFKLKADRVVFWLRQGAQPTDMVANLLDRVGIIRRTGPQSKFGEWAWRIPEDSGPEAPPAWQYDGPQEVTWGNKPMIRHRNGNRYNPNKGVDAPLIEKYGFKGYTKIPLDQDTMDEPLAGDTLLWTFGNTELPIY